jgi:hypothetical protein
MWRVKPGIKDNDAQTIDQAPHTETDVVGQNKIKKDPPMVLILRVLDLGCARDVSPTAIWIFLGLF